MGCEALNIRVLRLVRLHYPPGCMLARLRGILDTANVARCIGPS